MQTARRAVGGALLEERDGHVELRHAVRAGRLPRDPQTGQFEVAVGGVLQADHDLEQRVPRQRPGRVEHLDEPVERHVLVRVRGQRDLADALDQLGERRVAGHIGPQHQRVDEEPDEVVQRVVGAAGDRSAERDVGARAEPRQQRRQTRLQHHEQARLATPGQRRELGVHLGADLEAQVLAAVRGDRGPRPVQRQRQLLGNPGERLGPVRQLGGEGAVRVVLAAEQFSLPQGVVRVLHGQLGQQRTSAQPACAVRRREVTPQRSHRPLVTRDVVHQQQKDVLVRLDAENPAADGDLGGQVEPVRGRLTQSRRETVPVHVDPLQHRPRLVLGNDHLAGDTVLLGDHGPQTLVPHHDVTKRCPQRDLVELAGEPHGERDVVDRVRAFEAVEEPQPLLRERQRHLIGPFTRLQSPPGNATLRTDHRRQARHGRRLEQRVQLDLHPQHRADPADQPGREQRVTAEVEEVVVDADLLHAEDLGEQSGEHFLLRRTRFAAAPRGELGVGQRGPVELSIGRQREHVQLDDRRRDHVLRQGERAQVGLARHVRDQARVPHDHDRLRYSVLRGQRSLDFARLDAEPAQLHLLIGTPDELQLTASVPPDQIAGPIHPAPEGTRHEPLGRQRGPVQVTTRKSSTRNIKLTHDTGRNGPQRRVQHVHLGVDQWPADGHITGQWRAHRRAHGRLGRSVSIDHPTAGSPRRHHLGRTRLPRHDQAFEPLGHQSGQGRRRQRRMGNSAQSECQLVTEQLAVRQHERRPGEQRHADLPPRRIETQRGELQNAALGSDTQLSLLRRKQARDARMRDHDTLGLARRSGRIDHVRRMRRPQINNRVRGRGVQRRQRGEHDLRRGIRQHEIDPVLRVGGVDRQIGTTGLQHTQHRDDHVDRPRHRHRDHRLRPNTKTDQMMRHLIRPRIQLHIGHRRVPEHQRRPIGHLRSEQLRNRQRRHITTSGVPVGQDARTLVVTEQRQIPDELVRVVRERFHEPHQPRADRLDLGGGEHVGPVPELEPQPVREAHVEAQRIVGGVATLTTGGRDSHARRGRVRGVRVDRQVDEHGHGVEQLADPGLPLDLHQLQVLVLGEPGPVVLDLGQQRRQRRGQPRPHPHGHGVDAQPDQPITARQLGRPHRDRRAEQDIGTAGHRPEQHRPRTLHDRVHRQAPAPSHRRDA
ncbi:hypothetical protein Lesp02_06930 [Lentzea sp. NBRC 105346]|nr:hypothetical protein Lesp02_06930 [Lentzea sp. NBRC 105346]